MAVGLALATVYLLTATGNHSEAEDAVGYANGINEGSMGQVLHPHHLLWGALGWVVHNLALALGRDGGTLAELQAMNAVIAAAGIAFLWWWLRSLGFRVIGVALACGVVAFSYGYWFYAGEADVYVLSAAALAVCLAAAVRAAAAPSARSFALLGAVNGLAVLAHDTNVIFAAVALTALLVSRGGAATGELVRRGAAYALCAVAIAVPAYAAAAVASGHETPGQAYEWITGYAENDAWGKLEAGSAPKGAVGATRAVLGGHTLFATDDLADVAERLGVSNPREELFLMRDYPPALAFGVLAASFLLGVLLCVRLAATMVARRSFSATGKILFALCLTWIGAYAAFFTWWEPINLEFWIAVWIPLGVLIALPLAHRPLRRERALVAVVLGGLVAINLAGSILPAQGEDDDYWRVRTAWYAEHATPNDVVITNNYIQYGYVSYFSRARTVVAGARNELLVPGYLEDTDVRVLASNELFRPDEDRFSTCPAGNRECQLASIRREAFPRRRVIARAPLERVWLLSEHGP